MDRRWKIALIYPPYAPPSVPSLGLALLSAGIKARGFECRTFYWYLRVIRDLPGVSMQHKATLYRLLTGRSTFPGNEWVFAGCLYRNGELDDRAAETKRLVDDLDHKFIARRYTDTRLLEFMRARAAGWVSEMADELADYDLIGVNSTFYQSIAGLALLEEVKRRWPEKITVLGGANCDDQMGGALLELYPCLDYTFGGEVDHSFPEFVERLWRGESVEGLPGLFWRDRDGRVQGGPAPPLEDLDGLPIPDYDDLVAERNLFQMHEDGELVIALESSRGCWWGAKSHCTFCGLNANGMGYRKKSIQRFQAEVEEVTRRYGSRFLVMADNILAMEYYGEFMSWAKARGLDVSYFYEIKANVTRKQVAALADAGVTMVQPGIESFSTKVLTLMAKGVKGIQNVAFLKYAREYGVHACYNVLSTFPGEDPEEYLRMARQVPRLVHLRPPSGVTGIEFHRFSPYHRAPEEYGIKLRPDRRYRHVYPFSDETLARICYCFERSDPGANVQPAYLGPLDREVRRWSQVYDEDNCQLTWGARDGEIVIVDRRPSFPKRDFHLRGYAISLFRAIDDPRTIEGTIKEAERLHRGSPSGGDETAGPDLVALRRPARLASVPTAQPPSGDRPPPPWRVEHKERGFARFREEVVEFDRDDFLAEPKACLEWWVKLGFVYHDDDRYLALPVHEARRASMVKDWLATGA